MYAFEFSIQFINIFCHILASQDHGHSLAPQFHCFRFYLNKHTKNVFSQNCTRIIPCTINNNFLFYFPLMSKVFNLSTSNLVLFHFACLHWMHRAGEKNGLHVSHSDITFDCIYVQLIVHFMHVCVFVYILFLCMFIVKSTTVINFLSSNPKKKKKTRRGNLMKKKIEQNNISEYVMWWLRRRLALPKGLNRIYLVT